jgi:transcriptional regulator with XRE-family HTH domain
MKKQDQVFKAKALQHVETVRQAAISNGITYQQIANDTGLQQTNVARTLSGKYVPRLDLFLKISASVGVLVTLTVPRRAGKIIRERDTYDPGGS